MALIALVVTLSLVLIVPVALVVAWKSKYQGTLQVSSESVAYDKSKYGAVLDYDKHSFIIRVPIHGQRPNVQGKRTLILSGEFHYWRVPDRSRWRDLLLTYKAAGLNCVRIYFSWAYHSPRQGEYIFSDNRDVAYLLSVCRNVGLYVLLAPGPYICAGISQD